MSSIVDTCHDVGLGKVRIRAILACVGGAISASSAHAMDWTITSSLSQTFEANSNYQMQPNPPGPTYLPVSSALLNIIGRTPTMRVAATANLSYRTYFGPGAETLLPGLDHGFLGTWEKRHYLTTFKLEGSHRVQQASTLQLEETGTSTISGDVTTDVIEGGIRHQLSEIDQITWSARTVETQFSSPTGTPSRTVSTTGRWTHQLTALTALTPSGQFEAIDYSSAGGGKTEVTISRATFGMNSELTKRLSFQGGVGITYITVEQNGPPLAVNPVQLPLGGGAAADWLANALLTYRINPTDQLTIAATRSIGPDTLGTISRNEVIGLVWSRRINHWSTLAFSTNFSHQSTRVGTTDLYSASATYSYQLTPDWYAAVSYRFRNRFSEPEAHSHAIFFSIRHDLTILPSSAGSHGPRRIPVALVLDWPAAWTRQWRDTAWWQSSF